MTYDAEYHSKYRQANKKRYAEYQSKYHQANREKIAERKRKCRQVNKERIVALFNLRGFPPSASSCSIRVLKC